MKLPWPSQAEAVREQLLERPKKAASEFTKLLFQADKSGIAAAIVKPEGAAMPGESDAAKRLVALEKLLNSWLSAPVGEIE